MTLHIYPLTYYDDDENLMVVEHPYGEVWNDPEAGIVDVCVNMDKFWLATTDWDYNI